MFCTSQRVSAPPHVKEVFTAHHTTLLAKRTSVDTPKLAALPAVNFDAQEELVLEDSLHEVAPPPPPPPHPPSDRVTPSSGLTVSIHECRYHLSRLCAVTLLLTSHPPCVQRSVVRPVQWFPGHIAKAERQLKTQLTRVDLILEVRDARYESGLRVLLWSNASGSKRCTCLLSTRLMPVISMALCSCTAGYHSRHATRRCRHGRARSPGCWCSTAQTWSARPTAQHGLPILHIASSKCSGQTPSSAPARPGSVHHPPCSGSMLERHQCST